MLKTEALGTHAEDVRLTLQEAFFTTLSQYWAEMPEYDWQKFVDSYMEVIYDKKG